MEYNKIFKIIGAAAAAANLFLELSIPEKKEDKLTKNRKGNVSLVRFTARSNFKGSVENESLMKALANFSLMISASKEETFGLNVIESLSIGLPVLAFPAKAIKEIANNNPIVFFFDNEKSFLNSIENEICKIFNFHGFR